MKLYVVTRQDLSPGQQIAQSAHAVADWQLRYQGAAQIWHETSNTIICLSAENEYELRREFDCVNGGSIFPVKFTEPDFFDEWTAFAVLLRSDQSWVFAHLPLAGVSTGSFEKEAAKREAARNFAQHLTTNNIQR